MKRKIALISVSDKAGLEELAKALDRHGFELVSTGGTAKAIEGFGLKVTPVEKMTEFREMLDGRVKTLHPKLHAGILALRDSKSHMQQLKEANIMLIDLVVVNLYPFRKMAEGNSSLEEIIESIDIGGSTLVRAAAKNFHDVAVVVKPKQYPLIIEELEKNNGDISIELRRLLAAKAFEHSAYYDTTINEFLHKRFNSEELFPSDFSMNFRKAIDLRYGENPHQKAALYKESFVKAPSVANATVLNGKPLSFNNIIDANAAIAVVQEFKEPAVGIIKHNNACGAAVAENVDLAFQRALECDPKSAFGSIIALNRKCTLETAKRITSFFNEVVIACCFEESALEELRKKKNLRVLQLDGIDKPGTSEGMDYKKIDGGLLVQTKDSLIEDEADYKVVSQKKPSADEMRDLLFAWKIAKCTKSNAIILAKGNATVGVGAGQMSRVDSTELAIKKSGEKSRGSVLASDAFFPFRDNIDTAAKAGVTAIISPGGSIKDEEVIKAADEHGLVMLFTGIRHFRH